MDIDTINKILPDCISHSKFLKVLKINGKNIPGFELGNASALTGTFAALRVLEIPLSATNPTNTTSYANLLARSINLKELNLTLNPNPKTPISEQSLAQILTGIGSLERIKYLELGIGKVKKEGMKNIFLVLFEKMEKLYSLRLRFKEMYLTDEDLINLANILVTKRRLRTVILFGSFGNISQGVKDYFFHTLKNVGIKTPPLSMSEKK